MRSTIFTQLKSGIQFLAVVLLLGIHLQVSAQKTELPAEARNIPNYRELWANEPFSKYDPGNEIVEKRDQVSKHFRNADGTITAHIASGPINYWEDGQWKTIFHTIEKNENGNLSNLNNDFKTIYPALSSGSIKTSLPNGITFTDMQGMRMYYEANGQEVLSINIAANAGKADLNVLTYPSVYGSDIDLRFTQNTTTRKMDYILQNASALNNAPSNAQFLVFEEKITLPEGTVAKLENNVIHLYQYGNIIAQYTNPCITERANSQNDDIAENAGTAATMDALRETNNIKGEASGENGMHEGKYEIFQIDSELTVKLKVEMAWLLDASRTFPIEVDPTTNYSVDGSAYSCAYSTLRPGNNTCWDVTDATVEFYVGRNSDLTGPGSDDRWTDSYNRFDISSLPSSSAVSNATVFFTMHTTTSTTGLGTMALYKMDYNQITNSCPNFYTNISATAYSANFSGTTTSNSAGAHSLALNATGVADLQAKVGTSWFALAYRPTGTYGSASRLRTMRGSSQAAKPYIAVTYTSATITATSTMTAFTSCPSTASTSQSFTVSGTNMAAVITVTAPAGFQVSTDNSTWSVNGGNVTVGAAGTIANTTVYARMAAVASAPASSNIVCSSTGATSVNVAVSGSLFSVPTLSTTSASAVANFTATSGGNVTATGGSSVTASGVLWGTSPGLTMPSASSTSDGTGTGSFTSSITGLSASTVYYYRAYAQNCAGYGYGIEYSFVTTGPSAEGYYISGNIVNNGEIISTYDENYLRMTGASKTITGSGKFTNSKLFADGSTTFDATLDAASAFTETFVNAGKSLTVATGKTFKNGTMGNYGTLTIAGTGIINNTSNWVNGATGTVTFGGAGTIYAGANWTNDGTFTAGTGTVEFNGSTSGNTINGTTAFYNATINKGSSTATILDVNGTVTQSNAAANLTFTNGLLRIPSGGSWTKTSGGPTIGANSGLHVNGGTFTLNGASITNNGLFKTTTGTATIGNSSGNSITNQSGSSFIIDGAGTVNIAGRLVTTGTGSVSQSAGTLNICTSGNSTTNVGSIDMDSGTSFTMSGGAINMVQKSTGATQVDYRNLAGTVSISGGTLTIGTTATSASSNFNIQGAMPPLVVDNTTNAKTATINGTATVYGNVTINSTSSLVLNSGVNATVNGSLSNSGTYNATGTLNLAGNWVNNGTFTSNTGNTVVFNGSNASTIGGSGTDNFYNLTMSKTSASPQLEVTLADGNISVANTLTLTTGNLVTGSYVTHVTNNASAAVSGGSSNSYVVGKLKRTVAGANTYVFPVGKSLYEEATLAFSTGYTSADITAFFTDASPGSLPAGGLTQSGTNLVGMLDKGYWSIDPSAGAVGSPTYTVTLKETGHTNGTTNAANYAVIKRQNTPSVGDWTIQGTHSNITQSDDGMTVTAVRSALTTFSDFAIAYGSAPLPIELSSFQANCSDNNTVDVTWSTASEHNTNYFRVDKSRNGTQWDVLGTIGAAGNSTYTIDYALTDQFPNPGINYYRLTQYDNDGVFETFDVQAAVCKDQQSGTALSSYPNPSSGDFNVDLQTDELEGEATLLITDAKGAMIHSQDIKIIKGTNNYIIQRFDAEPGIYYVSVKAGASTVTTKHSLR